MNLLHIFFGEAPTADPTRVAGLMHNLDNKAVKTMEQVHIQANPKFRKLGKEPALRDLADQIAQLLYGKRYGTGLNGALGAR